MAVMTGPQFQGGSQMSGAAVSNTAYGSGSGAGAGGMFGAISVAQAISGVITSIKAGEVAKAQAKYNQAMLENKAKWIDLQKETDAEQYNRFRGRFISKSVASVGGAGLMMSGSPMAVLLDSVTQINIDKSVSQANLEQQKRFTIASAEMQGLEAKNATRTARVNAYSSILESGSNFLNYKTGGSFNMSQGAKNAGR